MDLLFGMIDFMKFKATMIEFKKGVKAEQDDVKGEKAEIE